MKGERKMETEKRLALLQNTYAAAVAESVNNYERLGVLKEIVARRKARQAQTAPYLNGQLGVAKASDVFCKLSEIYGCANWIVEKTQDGYIALASACKLCALAKKMGGANPCRGWCLDPMIAMICAACGIGEEDVKVESTLMEGERCKISVKAGEKQ
jgi:hypothetical protein